MPAIYEYAHTVRADEIDELGHVGNLHYLSWTLAAAVAHSTAQGWPTEAYHELQSVFVVRSHTIEYLRPAYEGEEIVVRTWVAGFRKASSLRRYEIVRRADGQKLAKATTDWAFVKLGSGAPTRLPADLIASFQLHEAETQ